jgi:hypothetical protein
LLFWLELATNTALPLGLRCGRNGELRSDKSVHDFPSTLALLGVKKELQMQMVSE